MKTGIDWSELRGAKAVSINGRCVYLLAGSQSKKYKGIKMSIENGLDEEFTFKIWTYFQDLWLKFVKW